MNRYNEQAFTPEDVEKGLHLDLINYLLSYNQKAESGYYDIHITTDSYCTIVQWIEVMYDTDFDSGKFEFVDEGEEVMLIRHLPDNTTIMCYDEDDYIEQLEEFLKDHPTYKQSKYGNWYDEAECIEPKEYINLKDLQMEQNENSL